MSQLQKITDGLQESAPEIVKDNKGALAGALVGYFLSDNKKAQSLLLGAIAGALLIDNKTKTDEDEDEE